MSKIKFYTLCLYIDKTDKMLKAGYLPREGYDVPNDLGIKLAVYKTKEKDLSCEDVTIWIVTDVASGLEVANGPTKKTAIDTAVYKLGNVGKEKLDEIRDKMLKEYGPVPGHSIYYLHGKKLS